MSLNIKSDKLKKRIISKLSPKDFNHDNFDWLNKVKDKLRKKKLEHKRKKELEAKGNQVATAD